MRIDVKHPYFDDYRLVDKDTNEEIEDFIYADDKIGEYEVVCRDKDGNTIIITDSYGYIIGSKIQFKKGNIKLVDIQYDE